MSNQQELIDVINDISKKQNHSYDTPATVLRVDGDTVWVHIDGGADETPVLKTISCQEGETVQVRISNGSAFLVGNASSPPTDDSMANVAHFVAEKAEIEATNAQNDAMLARAEAEMAAEAARQAIVTYETWYLLSATEPTQPTEEEHTGWSTVEPAWSSSSTDNLYFSIRTVKGTGDVTWGAVGMVQSYADLQILKNAIISTVASDYVAQGNSNVTSLSSTMLQNVNGVNIYNGTLEVGDSYAHIDGDSFDIKKVTTAGSIDDTNDEVLASFGSDETIIKKIYRIIDQPLLGTLNFVKLIGDSIKIGGIGLYTGTESGWQFSQYALRTYDDANGNRISINNETAQIQLEYGTDYTNDKSQTEIDPGQALFTADKSDRYEKYIHIDSDHPRIIVKETEYDQQGNAEDYQTIISSKFIQMNGNVMDGDGNNVTPTILTSSTISASTTSYTFSNSAIKTTSVLDLYDSIFGFSPTNMTVSNGTCTVTFPAQSSSHTMKLFIY